MSQPVEAKYFWIGILFYLIIGAILYIVIKLVFFDSYNPEKASSKVQFICRWKTVCSMYPDIRYDCASAGSFDKCMSVRMSPSLYMEAKNICTESGLIKSADAEVPNFARCFIAKFE